MKNIYLVILGLMVVAAPVSVPAKAPGVSFSVDEAVKEAILRSPDLKEAAETIAGEQEAMNTSRADLFTTATLNYSYTGLDKTPVQKTARGNVPAGHTNQYHWDLTLAQPLFTGFALTTRLDIAKLGVKDREIEREVETLDLAQDVKKACYNLLLTQKMLMVADGEVNSLTAHRDEARQFYKQGLIPPNDLLRSEVALADSIQAREKAGANVKSAMALLNTLMDADINRTVTIKDIDAVPAPPFDLEQLGLHAVEKRPVIQGLKNNVDKTVLSEKLAKSSRYPAISLVGRYEQNGDGVEAADNDYTNSHNSSLSLQAEWTFFDWGKTGSRMRKARHDKKALQEKIRGMENIIRLEVKNTLLNMAVARKNIKTAKQSLGQARENYRITNVQYAQQVATSSDVLDARSFLTRADTNYYQALYGYMASLADLDRALGDQ
ncbi:MAG: TolC family protein [Desulfobacteraceae bacterium]|nr:TolC family protein [Desulfobacteraceae bacterium]